MTTHRDVRTWTWGPTGSIDLTGDPRDVEYVIARTGAEIAAHIDRPNDNSNPISCMRAMVAEAFGVRAARNATYLIDYRPDLGVARASLRIDAGHVTTVAVDLDEEEVTE